VVAAAAAAATMITAAKTAAAGVAAWHCLPVVTFCMRDRGA